jgi:hypothetical protein
MSFCFLNTGIGHWQSRWHSSRCKPNGRRLAATTAKVGSPLASGRAICPTSARYARAQARTRRQRLPAKTSGCRRRWLSIWIATNSRMCAADLPRSHATRRERRRRRDGCFLYANDARQPLLYAGAWLFTRQNRPQAVPGGANWRSDSGRWLRNPQGEAGNMRRVLLYHIGPLQGASVLR